MLVFIVSLMVLGAAKAQNCDSINTDICGAKVWPFLIDPKLAPGTEQELEETCRNINEGQQCIIDYLSNCPNVVNKEIAESVLDSFRATINDYCGGNLGKRFLPHGACLQQKLHLDFPCNDEAIQDMEAISVYEPASERLRLTCCAYLKLDKCFTRTTTKACNQRASRAVRNLMQSFAIFMVDKCLPFLANADQCDLSVLKNVQRPARQPKTFLPALVDVAAVAF